MRCPSCLALFQESVEACQSCGLTLALLDKKFGTVPKSSRHITDKARFYRKSKKVALAKKLADIKRNFPGLHLSIVTLRVHHLFKPREYFFWLMNRGQFIPMDCRLERSFSIVLFFDSASKSVFLSTGYGLQAALPEATLEKILGLALPYFRKKNYYRGTIAILRTIKRQLKSHCLTGLPKSAPKGEAPTPPDDKLKPMEDLF